MNMDEHPAIRTDCRKSFVFDNDYLDRRDPRDDPRSVPRYFRAASFPACLTHATTRLIVGNLALGLQRKPENDLKKLKKPGTFWEWLDARHIFSARWHCGADGLDLAVAARS
jgi:hypothetical protein